MPTSSSNIAHTYTVRPPSTYRLPTTGSVTLFCSLAGNTETAGGLFTASLIGDLEPCDLSSSGRGVLGPSLLWKRRSTLLKAPRTQAAM
eukprot:933059-Pleurochrysis_carterae.AAC.1